MQITTSNTRTAADIKVGSVLAETVQLAGDIAPRQHRFVVTDRQDQPGDSLPGTIQVTATDEMGGEVTLGFDAAETVTIVREPFAAGYAQADVRVFRKSFRASRTDGTATIRFEGTVHNVLSAHVARRGDGRIDLFAEVEPTDDTLTEIKVAVVPTGKRVPLEPNSSTSAIRLGSVGGQHVYLLGVDSSADRAEYEARKVARKAAREARALLADAGYSACQID